MTLYTLAYIISATAMLLVFLIVGWIGWEYERSTITTTDVMLAVFAIFCPVLNSICLAGLVVYLVYHGINMLTFSNNHD